MKKIALVTSSAHDVCIVEDMLKAGVLHVQQVTVCVCVCVNECAYVCAHVCINK